MGIKDNEKPKTREPVQERAREAQEIQQDTSMGERCGHEFRVNDQSDQTSAYRHTMFCQSSLEKHINLKFR